MKLTEALLTRVEGEGEALIQEKDGIVENVIYRITEAPRFFEYIVRGREMSTVVDIVSRVCGLCGVSYVLVASKAFEECLGVDVDERVDSLRTAIHLAERVKSHMIHLFYLNLPDLISLRTSIEFMHRNPQIARDASQTILWSRKAMEILGGRFHNIVNIAIGGVHRVPSREDVERLRRDMGSVVESFKRFADFMLSLRTAPEVQQKLPLISLYSEGRYPHISNRVAINGGVYSIVEFYRDIVKAIQRPHSNALHYRVGGIESFVVGPIARFNQFYNSLSKEVRDLLEAYGWRAPLKNIFQSFVARIAEVYEALINLKEFLQEYRQLQPQVSRLDKLLKSTVCEAAIEAPRGILYHRYSIDERGKVVFCDIATPTAQNLAAMEDIAVAMLRGRRVDEDCIAMVKRIAVSFDPCLSCSVHAIPVKIITKS